MFFYSVTLENLQTVAQGISDFGHIYFLQNDIKFSQSINLQLKIVKNPAPRAQGVKVKNTIPSPCGRGLRGGGTNPFTTPTLALVYFSQVIFYILLHIMKLNNLRCSTLPYPGIRESQQSSNLA